jgi:hypothetical protein
MKISFNQWARRTFLKGTAGRRLSFECRQHFSMSNQNPHWIMRGLTLLLILVATMKIAVGQAGDDPTEMGMKRVARQFTGVYQSPEAESLGESKSHLVYHKSQIVHFAQPGLVLNLLLTISNL